MFFFVCSGLEVYPSLQQKKLKTTSSTCLQPPVTGSSKCSQLFWREMRSVFVEEFCIFASTENGLVEQMSY